MTATSNCTGDFCPNADKMTIVLVAFNMHGHFRPIFAFGEQLIQYGGPNVRVIPVIPCNSGSTFPTDEFPNLEPVVRLLMPDDIPNVGRRQFEWLSDNEEKLVDDAVEQLRPLNPTAICYDPFTGFGQTVAEILGIKHVALFTSPLSFYYLWCQGKAMCQSTDTCLNSLESDDKQADSASPQDLHIPTIGFVNRCDVPDAGEMANYFVKNTQKMRSLRSVVVNSSPREPGGIDLAEAFKSQLLRPTSAHDTGDVHLLGYFGVAGEGTSPVAKQTSASEAKLPEIEWLDQQPDDSVIFVALGSWCQLPVADVVELAEGLAATNTNFLWALRDRAPVELRIPHAPAGYKPREPVCETEPCGLPIGFRDRLRGRGLIVPWVRQPEVLSHRAIKLFVTHCGWNSLSESICLSPVPKAFLPLAAEQGLNAHIGQEQWKIGKRLWGSEYDRSLDRQKVSQILLDIMGDEEICANARKLYEEHNEYRTGGIETAFHKLLAELAAP